MTKKSSGPRIRDLHPDVQLELKREQAKKLAAEVRRQEAARDIQTHKANIEKIKGT